MPTQTSPQTLNGIDVGALGACIDGVRADPARGMTRWRVHSRWVGGTRTDHEVQPPTIGGVTVPHAFTIRVDEPRELCGTDLHANPQEVLLSAVNACMMVGYSAVAALMGIRLRRLEIDLEGDIDLRGFLGIDAEVRPGYDGLRQTVFLEADAPREQLERLHEVVKATSPNYFNVTTAIPMASVLVIR
jgi:uncharacterized OsmC-like protein